MFLKQQQYLKINRVPVNKYDKKLDIIITEKYVLK